MLRREKRRGAGLVGTDIGSLRTRWTVVVVLCGSFFLGLWLIATDRASEHAYLEREQARLEAVASSAAVVLDGGRLAEEGTSRADLERLVVRLAASQGLSASVSVLARGPKDTLEVVAASLPVEGERPLTAAGEDPELSALLEGDSALVARVVDGHLVTFAPIRARDHRVTGLVRVEGAANRPELDRNLSRAGLSLAGLLLLFVLTRATDHLAARHVSALEGIARGEGATSLGRFPSREVLALARALGGSTAKADPGGSREIPPAPKGSKGTNPPVCEPSPGGVSPIALAESVATAHRERAAKRNTTLEVRGGIGVPTCVGLDTDLLATALDAALENAVRATRDGTIHVRVSRDESTPCGACLRYDVVDSGTGLSLVARRGLAAQLSAAERRARAGIALAEDRGLPRAAHAAALLGGELSLDSQQGSGTRVWMRFPLT